MDSCPYTNYYPVKLLGLPYLTNAFENFERLK